MALYFSTPYDPEKDISILSVSPKVMKWDERIWLCDLQPCLSFWEKKSNGLELSLESLLQQVLCQMFSPEKIDFIAAFAPHPWRALLYIGHIKFQGHLNSVSFFDMKTETELLREVTWFHWFDPMDRLSVHLEAFGYRLKDCSEFRKQKRRMTSAVERLQIDRPYRLCHADGESITKRFGSILGDVWAWTFPRQFETEAVRDNSLFSRDAFASEFPWADWDPAPEIQCSRDFEDHVSQWDHLEPYLVDDLDVLAQEIHPQERVTVLEWVITLDQLEQIFIPIVFRNPHSLLSEKGKHETSMSQLRYGFEKVISEWNKEQRYLSNCRFTYFVKWDLTIKERIYEVGVPKHLDVFLPIDKNSNEELEKVMALENKLMVDIKNFHIDPVFDPYNGYSQVCGEHKKYDFCLEQWEISSKNRPLFISDPIPMESIKHIKRMYFTERIDLPWWEAGIDQESFNEYSYADFYIGITKDLRSVWLSKDSKGKWKHHGFFD